MLLVGSDGNDSLDGDVGRDVLRGGTGNDELEGSDGKDELYGGKGRDHIEGGEGNDQLAGGGGSDVFEFDPGSGRDTITDWRFGSDVMDLDDFSYNNFRELRQDAFQVGDDVVFSLDDGGQITVLGVEKSEFNGNDFIL